MSLGNVTKSSNVLSTAIVNAVAEHEGVNPLELKQPLYDVIDTDALDTLFNESRSEPDSFDATVSFPYNGYIVTVTSGGDVQISDPTE